MASEPRDRTEAATPAPQRIAQVLVRAPLGPLDYRLPDGVEVAVGDAVRVPLGGREVIGYVRALASVPVDGERTLKEVVAAEPAVPALTPALVELLVFAADYYLVPPGDLLSVALPPETRSVATRYVLDTTVPLTARRLGKSAQAALEVAEAFPRGFGAAVLEKALGWSRPRALRQLRALEQAGLVRKQVRRGAPRELAAYVRLEADPSALGARAQAARALWDSLPTGEPVVAAELAREVPNVYAKLAKLERHGLVERRAVERRVDTIAHGLPTTREVPVPTPAQGEVIATLIAALDAGRFGGFLLHGVTGSGKTEVYLRIIEEALARGKTALVLVPEIALTPQLGARFRARFGDQVATFHSGLTQAERRDEWERVERGEARVGLGARSALFLPLRELAVVIVDEEHEGSFKQDESPRYNARDLAVVRAHRAGALVVLGSATPSLETRHNALKERYTHLVLPERVASRPLPEVMRIDMSHAVMADDGALSVRLATALEETMRAGEQAILLLNRRGFAPYVYCRDCGHAFRCPDCDVSLTLHKRRGALLCHYCGHELEAPEACPNCLGHRLTSAGLGTERLEGELRLLLGDVPMVRLDRDSVRRRSDLERLLDRFARGEARVLLGTQMVAKGHDFPGVTLVGVVAADATLNLPDFRAAERTFQLLTQVAGRAGRGERPGQVIVQAYETRHYALEAAAAHDYERFAVEELRQRRELRYPPFAHLALVRLDGVDERVTAVAAADRAEAAGRIAAQLGTGVEVLGPAPAPLSRLKGKWRYQILLKAGRRSDLRAVLLRLTPPRERGVRQSIDVDPLNML